MNIIITGASGFLGLALTKQLLAEGHTVYGVLSRHSHNAAKLPTHPRFVPVRYNLGEDIAPLLAAVPKADTFVHFAWAGTKGDDRLNHEVHFANVAHSHKLLQAAAQMGCTRFLFAGSQAEYGIHHEPITEQTPCHPISEYGKAKLCFGVEGAAVAADLGLDFVHLRIFSTYGVGDHEHTLISSCVHTFLQGGDMQMGDCLHTWNFLYIDDEARLLAKMATAAGSLSAHGTVYNVAGDDTRRLRDFVLEVHTLCGKRGRCLFGAPAPKPEGIVQLNPCIDKTCSVLDWRPQVPFSQGIRRIIQNYSAEI